MCARSHTRTNDRNVYHTLLISHLSKFMTLKNDFARNCIRLLDLTQPFANTVDFRRRRTRTRNEMISWNMDKLRNTFHKLSPKKTTLRMRWTVMNTFKCKSDIIIWSAWMHLAVAATPNEQGKYKNNNLNVVKIEKLFMHLIKLTYKRHYFITALFQLHIFVGPTSFIQ